MVVPFHPTQPSRSGRRRPSSPTLPINLVTQQRVRSQIDRFQVLALMKPKLAVWLINFVDLFIDRHVG